MRAITLAGLTLVAVLTLAACGDDGSNPDGSDEATSISDPTIPGSVRGFEMGFGHLLAERTADGYEAPFRIAGEQGELILLQRGPAWADFLPGSSPAPALQEMSRTDLLLAERYELEFFLAVDPTDPTDRGRLFDAPPQLAGMDFRDPPVREAYLAYISFLAESYRPRYMALAVEVNLMHDLNPESYEAFRGVYEEAYTRVKQASPQTSVFVTFQYEDLKGLPPYGEEHGPRWELIDDFASLDLLALTTYPGFSFSSPADIPPDYYDEALVHTDLRVAIAEMGFNSDQKAPAETTEEDQRLFLARTLFDVSRLGFAFAVWFVPADPNYTLPAPFDSLASVGLIRADGSQKPAWGEWTEVAARPYDPLLSSPSGEADETAQDSDGAATPPPGTSATTPTSTPPAAP
ncbi:MAG: hypothetical protein WEB00_03790 [Dehalococcoidia bacterium]